MVGNASGLLDHDRLGTTSPILSGFTREKWRRKGKGQITGKGRSRSKGLLNIILGERNGNHRAIHAR